MSDHNKKALQMKRALDKQFYRNGIAVAIISGVCYGLFTAFLNLGMACNATYAFWGPLFCWLILGLGFGQSGWDIPLIGWVSAVVMVLGIFIIAVDPRTLLKRGNKHDAA